MAKYSGVQPEPALTLKTGGKAYVSSKVTNMGTKLYMVHFPKDAKRSQLPDMFAEEFEAWKRENCQQIES